MAVLDLFRVKKIALKMAKIAIVWHMKGHGYTQEQRVALIGKIGDGKIWEIIKKYGPIILEVFLKYILPLLLVMEEPKGPMLKEYHLQEDEEHLLTSDTAQMYFDLND